MKKSFDVVYRVTVVKEIDDNLQIIEESDIPDSLYDEILEEADAQIVTSGGKPLIHEIY